MPVAPVMMMVAAMVMAAMMVMTTMVMTVGVAESQSDVEGGRAIVNWRRRDHHRGGMNIDRVLIHHHGCWSVNRRGVDRRRGRDHGDGSRDRVNGRGAERRRNTDPGTDVDGNARPRA
jgi:hypothetical protein